MAPGMAGNMPGVRGNNPGVMPQQPQQPGGNQMGRMNNPAMMQNQMQNMANRPMNPQMVCIIILILFVSFLFQYIGVIFTMYESFYTGNYSLRYCISPD